MTQSLKTLIPLSLGILVLLGYSFLGAQAPANPPSGNTSSPINTSATSQTKIGPLIIGGLTTASSGLSVNGNATIFSTIPSLILYDESTGETPYRLRIDANHFQVLTNHDKDTDWFDDTSPLVLYSHPTVQTLDTATFSNKVQATEFCNKAGDCLTVPQPGSGPATAAVVRTIRIANPAGNALLSAARSEWNTIINTTYNNHPAQSDPVVIGTRDKCRWQDTETHPTSGNVTAKDTQEDALQECANFVCGHHPSTDLGFQTKMTNAYHGGDGGGNRGVYKIDCFY